MTSERTPVAISRFLRPFHGPMGEPRSGDRAERTQVEFLEGHGREWVLEGEFRNEFERPVAEEGVGVRS